jgi:glycosyltransferase involved in cell wall biosynthesis
LMIALQDLGFNNRLVSLNPVGGLGPLLEEKGIPAKGLSYRGPAGMFSIPAMAREFRQAPKPDGVVVTGHNLAAFGSLTGLDCKKRVLMLHFHHAGVKSAMEWRLIYAAAMRVFQRVVFCSDFIRAEAEEIFPPLRRISLTLPNPFRLPPRPRDEDRSAARRTLGIPDGTAVVGNCGWLIQRKRWDVFLRTAARIKAEYPNVVFLACGDGPLREELKEQCRVLGLDANVRWLGWQKDLTTFYLSLDVLMFHSDWDAQCRPPLEAGSYEVPSVASCLHGGIQEVIGSDDVGFLVDRHDEEWLAARTLELLRDSGLRRRMGAACRSILAEKHDPGRSARRVLELLDLCAS